MIRELIANPSPVEILPSPSSSAQYLWKNPPAADLRLEINEVHLWLARLDDKNAADAENFSEIISREERSRAARFRFATDKNQFIAARGILRTILGTYLHKDPQEICFTYGEFGKPALADEWLSEIKFNVSHSGGLAVYAVTRCREIGVDIEQIKSSFVDEAMIAFCLTAQEKEYMQALPLEKRELFFFECWTRKESFMKACGMGLALSPPNEIETLSFTNSSSRFPFGGSGFKPDGWSLQTLPFIPDGYAAALTTQADSHNNNGGTLRLKFLQHKKSAYLV